MEIMVTGTFSAAHWLPGYDGKCAFPHGHTYHYIIHIESEYRDMVVDFNFLKSIIEEIYDHSILNIIPPELGRAFDNMGVPYKSAGIDNPTSERVSLHLRNVIMLKIQEIDCNVEKVEVQVSESPSSTVFFNG